MKSECNNMHGERTKKMVTQFSGALAVNNFH